MPAAALTKAQTLVLSGVCASTPHATLSGLAYLLNSKPNHVQISLNALIRRGFVTPVAPTRLIGGVALEEEAEVYIATAKGKRRVIQ